MDFLSQFQAAVKPKLLLTRLKMAFLINICAFCLPSGFDSLMISYRLSDLALLYQLFSRVKRGQDELCSAFNEYIKVHVHECIARI